jgi:hypothetical protein
MSRYSPPAEVHGETARLSTSLALRLAPVEMTEFSGAYGLTATKSSVQGPAAGLMVQKGFVKLGRLVN